MAPHARQSAPPVDELDDLTLARAQRGDAAAYRDLVLCYQRRVFAYLWPMLGRAEVALVEDVAQDTFVNVHRGLGRFDRGGAARLGTWILTIATRVALNHLRRKPLGTEPLGPAADAVPGGGTDAAVALAVRDALDRMTPDHRAILLLREVHGLDYQEIAAALELDLGTVRSRLSRARAALRAALSEDTP